MQGGAASLSRKAPPTRTLARVEAEEVLTTDDLAARREALAALDAQVTAAEDAWRAAQAEPYRRELWQAVVDAETRLLEQLGNAQSRTGTLRALGAHTIWRGESLTYTEVGKRLSASRQRATEMIQAAERHLAATERGEDAGDTGC